MWLQRTTNYLLWHRWQTAALVFVSTFIPVVGIVGIIIAALITLRKGIVEGGLLTIAATLPYIISSLMTGTSESTLPIVLWAVVGVAVLSNALTWVFAVMLRRQASWSLILQIAALLGVLVVSIIHLAYPEIADWWGGQLQAYYSQAKTMTAMLKSTATSGGDVQLEAINATKQYATGLMVVGVLFNAVLQLIAARWWQSLVFSPGSLRKELHAIRLSQLAGVLFAVSLVLWYLGNSVVLDIMPILFVLFGAAGLSLVHYLFGLLNTNTRWFWLAVFYIALLISMPTSLVLVSLIALLDIWFDVRKRFKKFRNL